MTATFQSSAVFSTPQYQGIENTISPLRSSGAAASSSLIADIDWPSQIATKVKHAFQHLEEDWDDMGGQPPTAYAAETTIQVAQQLRSLQLGQPTFFPTSDGGFAMEWASGDDVLLTVDIGPDGTIDIDNSVEFH